MPIDRRARTSDCRSTRSARTRRSPRRRRIGLGIARGTSPDGSEGVYLTEVLAAPIEQSLDPDGEVARLLQQKRRSAGLRPLSRDVRALASEGELSRDLQRSVIEEALRSLPRLRGAIAEAYVGSGASATGSSPNAVSPAWTRVGIGA